MSLFLLILFFIRRWHRIAQTVILHGCWPHTPPPHVLDKYHYRKQPGYHGKITIAALTSYNKTSAHLISNPFQMILVSLWRRAGQGVVDTAPNVCGSSDSAHLAGRWPPDTALACVARSRALCSCAPHGKVWSEMNNNAGHRIVTR